MISYAFDIFQFHLIFTSLMVGVIWVIQLVHYPSFHYVKKDNYPLFQRFHMQRISIIVMPLMIIELLSGSYLVYDRLYLNIYFLSSILILLVIWLLTAVIFSGLHQRLEQGYDESLVNKMILYNWIRTSLWTLRLLLINITF
jgi:hypothetical protein